MSRYIDADELKELYEGCEDLKVKCAVVLLNIDDIPTADVAEVVRCKDCEHFDTTNCSYDCGWCDVWNIGRFEDGYCDKGKKVE